MNSKDQALDVWGDFACFTRPELKVERFSYPVITPSAARGIFDAIYCKRQEFRWQVTRVEILTPPSFIALRRNEVKGRASETAIRKWMRGTKEPEPLMADGLEEATGRTQRQTMALRDVRYRLHGEIRPWPQFEEHIQALEAQFRRRAAHGKCIYQPCFGCREFPAYFELVEVGASSAVTTPLDLDVGWMVYDVFDLSRPGDWSSKQAISLFNAKIESGVLHVPPYESDSVRKAVAPC
jgi:CRISPR-associated protein Cas5d